MLYLTSKTKTSAEEQSLVLFPVDPFSFAFLLHLYNLYDNSNKTAITVGKWDKTTVTVCWILMD